MSEGRGLDGHLELVCDVDSRGWTRLRHQSFRAPFHLSKPHHDAGALVLNVVNPTAGLLEGDRLRSEVRVKSGARLVLTTPSANRIHTMRGGKAENFQTFGVESGGGLEVWPELLIPQRGARYSQKTVVELAPGAEFLFFETLAPGRVASGEVFVFDELRWMTDVRFDGRLVARERHTLNPADASVGAIRRAFPSAYYGSAILIAPRLKANAPALDALRQLHADGVWLGISPLEATYSLCGSWRPTASFSGESSTTSERSFTTVSDVPPPNYVGRVTQAWKISRRIFHGDFTPGPFLAHDGRTMLAKVFSAAVLGVDAYEVEVEVNMTGGKPEVFVVGLPDAAVKESRYRVTTAVANSGYRYPPGRCTVNLAPAHIKKEGPSFDLPMAVGMAAVGEEVELPALKDAILVGELALTGAVRPMYGALAVAWEARRQGKKRVFVPVANVHEAAYVKGIDVYGIHSLREVFEFLRGGERAPVLEPVQQNAEEFFGSHQEHEVDFSEVKGQHHAKRALEIAAAGAHNVLMIGPPGSGKSMLAKRIPSILPPLTLEEALETTKVHSIAGLLKGNVGLVTVPPFSAPHSTISEAGLLGGSSQPTPGEISICHHGVLFLDELPEFRRSVLESLRQPLEDRQITISRAAGTLTFPANFVLVGAMNPCPCGYHGSLQKSCRCSPLQVQRYRERISGPLLDRIDLHVEVPTIKYEHLADQAPAESSASIRARVVAARSIQQRRAGKANARLSPKQIKVFCRLDDEGTEMLRLATSELNLSARAYDRVLKVARTAADLDGSESIQSHHLSEAIQYRTLDR